VAPLPSWSRAITTLTAERFLLTSELYQLTRKYHIASLPLQQRGKDRKGALPEQLLQSMCIPLERPRDEGWRLGLAVEARDRALRLSAIRHPLSPSP
jgi:hypothetical protein